MSVLRAFGFNDFTANLSTKDPEKYVGSDENWERATDCLRLALEKYGLEYKVKEGDAAFYGPKIDIDVTRRHRPHLAAQHDPVRLQPARAVRARVRGRRQRPAPPDHVAPRPVRLGRALLRRAARALRRRVPHVDGAAAGARAAGGRGPRGLRPPGGGSAARRGLARRRRRGRRSAGQAHPRGEARQDPVRARGGRQRRRGHDVGRQPAWWRGRARRVARRVRRSACAPRSTSSSPSSEAGRPSSRHVTPGTDRRSSRYRSYASASWTPRCANQAQMFSQSRRR